MIGRGECDPGTHAAFDPDTDPFSMLFVMEQHLGHRTYSENIRRALDGAPSLRADFVPVWYRETDRWWERVPSGAVRSALRGRHEVVTGIRAAGRADVHVFNTQVPAALGGRVAASRPFVLCMDDTPMLMDSMAEGYEHSVDGPVIGRAKHLWNRRLLHRADAIAPWSGWVSRSLIADYGVSASKIEVIPPGVEVDLWTPVVDRRPGPMRILFVGGDFVRKGGHHLVRAFHSLEPGTAELDVVTRSDVEPADGLRVHRGLTQDDPELRSLFENSDVFVMASSFETFGIAVIEAAAAGVPAIVADVGGLGGLVDDGETGFRIPPDDPDAIESRLRLLLDDPDLRRRLGRCARQRAEADFDARTNAYRLVDLARCVARNQAKNPSSPVARARRR